MIWWWRVCRAAWDRYDEWRAATVQSFAPDEWFWRELRRQQERPLGPRDTGKRPGQRYVGRHRAVPNDPVRRPS